MHDCKAEQLAHAGRFEEALAACRPSELGDPPPIELRGRAAWVEGKRGDKVKAIGLMKQIVAEDPTFVLGWRQLAAWYDALERYRECLDAADQFAKLEPDNPLAYVYRGEARRSVGDRRGALADFQKAFDMDAEFDAAGLNLITEQLAADDVAGAARTLNKLREHADGPLLRLKAVQVACKQADPDAAMTHFRGLATDAEVTRGLLREASAAFDAAGWGSQLNAELRELSEAEGANADIAGLWAERVLESESVDLVSERLPGLVAKNPPAGREVVLAYVWAGAAAGRPVQGTVQRYNDVLRSDDSSWARSGAALVAAGHFSYAAAWLAEFRDRSGVEAWMIRPLATALRAIDQDEKALEVCRAAVRLGGPDETLSDFRVWLALDLALSGQTEEAAGHIGRVDGVTSADGTRLILAFAEALVMVQQAGPAGQAAAFREAKEHLKTAAGAVLAKDIPAGAGRAYRKLVSRLAADAGTISARAWALWQRVRPLVG
jgi:tetratricopeptide (TPR) repeat protein